MTHRKVNLSILLIMLITFLTAIILNLVDSSSVADATNIKLSSSTTPPLKTIVKAENTATPSGIAEPKTIVEDTGIQNGQLVIMQRPDWKFEGNLKEQLERLKIAAENGNDEASYVLAMNLRHCYYSPVDDIAFEKKLEQVYEFSDNELAVANITKRYEYCSGIDQKQRNQFYNYSKDAASNGYVAAQEYIGSITSELFMESQGYKNLERDQFIKVRDGFIEQKIGFLQQAAKNGSIKALIRLSNMNHSQNYGENGHVKSFAFNQLILELTQNNKTYNKYSWFQQRMHPQLTSDEIDNAFAMSEEWLEIIRSNGTLYLNGN